MLLLAGAGAAALLGLFMPGLAWAIGAGIVVLASLLILPIGIRPFLAVCCVTLTHFLALGPPAPYGRSELPMDYLLGLVVMPLTLAAASLAIGSGAKRSADRAPDSRTMHRNEEELTSRRSPFCTVAVGQTLRSYVITTFSILERDSVASVVTVFSFVTYEASNIFTRGRA